MATLIVGVPKEIKDREGRVSVQPDGVAELVYAGHQVVVQAGAGSGCGLPTHSSRRPAPRSWAPRTRCSPPRT
jgi:alanine dehydrogenase